MTPAYLVLAVVLAGGWSQSASGYLFSPSKPSISGLALAASGPSTSSSREQGETKGILPTDVISAFEPKWRRIQRIIVINYTCFGSGPHVTTPPVYNAALVGIPASILPGLGLPLIFSTLPGPAVILTGPRPASIKSPLVEPPPRNLRMSPLTVCVLYLL